MTAPETITFYLNDREEVFSLPKEDGRQIKNALKKYVNQIGFH